MTRPATIKSRFYSKVQVDAASGCWLWTASTDDRGYGQMNVAKKPTKAHRIAWQLFNGEVPIGLTLDHLCRVVRCVNPEHLEPVTRAENTRRQMAAIVHHNSAKTHCANGHAYSADNTRYASRGRGRVCRICRATSNRTYRERATA